jgi:lipopolysaccharide/colanic/teichoic acid biosynthesis glycosyltransferase
MESMTGTMWREEGQTSSTTESSTLLGNTTSIDTTRNYSLLNHASKRLFDIVLATFGIVALIPVFFVLAVCIKLEDGGGIFYFREMIGLRGRRFFILKFRTMIPNADIYLEQHHELKLEYQKNMKLQYDPRITRIGRFLRKTYLDELPQLFNVLVGQMSFVGPRAIHQSELALYGKYAEKRHSVKPGITGLWQISPDRYRCYEERIPLDMQYIDKRSFFLDLAILFKTLRVLLICKGV